jgi:phosphotransferase system IIB component
MKQDCGDTTSDNWNANYCDGNAVKQSRVVHSKGCAANACFSSDSTETQTVTTCQYGCSNGACVFPACLANSGCGTDGFVGAASCSGNNVYQSYKKYACNNPGTLLASCSSETLSSLKETCAYGCSGGVCNPAPVFVKCITNIRGDLNDDYKVDNSDLLVMLSAQANKVILSGNTNCIDLDKNGKVDIFDLLALLKIMQEKPSVKCITNIKGDLNDDSKVDIFDLLALLKVLDNKVGLSENIGCIDLDKNGKVDIFDLIALLKILSTSSSKQAILQGVTPEYRDLVQKYI